MPLPQNVIAQLGRESSEGTQGWATGALLFSGGILALALVIYFGLTFGYEPYLQNQLAATRTSVKATEGSVTSGEQSQLIDFYSQIANLKTLLQNHVLSSKLLTWLEKNTEANVSYQSFTLTSGDHVTLAASARSEADVNQQIAIFESSPEVAAVAISGITAPILPGQPWTFNVSLSMNPSVVAQSAAQ